MAARGGIIESVEINDCDNQNIITPNGQPIKHELTERLLKSMLGKDFNEIELSKAINRMGGTYLGKIDAPSNSLEKSNKMGDVILGDKIIQIEMQDGDLTYYTYRFSQKLQLVMVMKT